MSRLLTRVVPVAFVATVPAPGLTRGGDSRLAFLGLVAAGGAVAVALVVWRVGLRRYAGAMC